MRSVLLAVLVVATSAGLTLERWREQGKSPVQRELELRARIARGLSAVAEGRVAHVVVPAGGRPA